MALTDAGAGQLGGVDDGVVEEEDEPPAPRTAADRFRNIRVVQSALGADMLALLRKSGVSLESQSGPSVSVSTGTEEAGLAEDEASARECTRLGLDVGPQRRLPMPGPLRLPVCTIDQQVGLWDRFRKFCGTKMPAEPPPIQCEIRKSRGGGQVVVPKSEALVAAGS